MNVVDFSSRNPRVSLSSSSGRTLIFGDIHGCDRALATVLELAAPTANDHLICVGDLIDRGPSTKQVLDRLLDIRTRLRLSVVRGNHEEMFLDALEGGGWTEAWWRHGGEELLESYGPGTALGDLPRKHVEFLRESVDFLELAGCFVTHAAPVPALPIASQAPEGLRWRRIDPHDAPHESGKTILCGHTPQQHRHVHVHPGWVCLDTWVYDPSGCLTALELETGTLYQASEWAPWCDIGRITIPTAGEEKPR